ncbi:MAG: DUF72 domain-containing protein [Cytophagaceae bacterium]|nr:DUF72 domain-containing protein [Cytophagaceae bacterium]
MDFGKVEDPSKVDFTLPPDHPNTAQVLSQSTGRTFRAFVGLPIWANKEWAGKIYPSTARDKEFLHHYTRQFNTIELNTTHYRIPDEATIRHWKAEATPGFRYCPKFPQSISHERQLLQTEELTREFCDQILALGEHLGMSFLQLSPAFSPRQVGALEAYLEKLPEKLPLAVEFRHPDWFRPETWEKTLQLLARYNKATVIADVSGRRDVLHQSLSIPMAFVRFIANEGHSSDHPRADAWIQRLKTWMDAGLETLYLFIHSGGQNDVAPELAAYWIRELNQRAGLSLPEPKFLPKVTQTSLF